MENMLLPIKSPDEHAPTSSISSPSKEDSASPDSEINCSEPQNIQNTLTGSSNDSKVKGLDKYIDFRKRVGDFFSFNWFKYDIYDVYTVVQQLHSLYRL